jgi:hypothetical protein
MATLIGLVAVYFIIHAIVILIQNHPQKTGYEIGVLVTAVACFVLILIGAASN